MRQAVIVVVEDDPLGLELATEMLTVAGYTVRSSRDGVGLLGRVTAERPDLILMDLQLPEVDGVTLIRQLKADDRTRQIPIIVTTAYSEPALHAQAMEVGCAAYLTKPLNFNRLLETIDTLLKR